MITSLTLCNLFADFELQTSPFATHVNLLRALGAGTIRTVLELGAGEFSTRTFLDRKWFPDLTHLLTVEHDADWAERMKSDDLRAQLIVVPEPINFSLEAIHLPAYDLILCDNSASGDWRCYALRYLAKHVDRSLVVAHDYDVLTYQEAAKEFRHSLIDDRQRPWTALLWN
jgi:hypothetical protein